MCTVDSASDLLEQAAREKKLLRLTFRDRFRIRPSVMKYVMASMPCECYLTILSHPHHSVCCFFLVHLLFSLFHYGIAATIILVVMLVVGLTRRFDFHAEAFALLPVAVTIAEPIVMIFTWYNECMGDHSLLQALLLPNSWHIMVDAGGVRHAYGVPVDCILEVSPLLLSECIPSRVLCRDPGVVDCAPDHSHFVELVESGSKMQGFCFTCWIPRKAHMKHCSTCDRLE